MSRLRTRMRPLRSAALVVIASMSASAVAAACADSEVPRFDPAEDGGPPGARRPDGAADDAGADVDADALAPDRVDACSAEGWCATEIDPQLSFDDLWPLEESAVAVASRDGRSSVRLYEGSSWKLIHEVPFLLASVWASTEDVWVSGADGYVAHGRRSGNGWAWAWTAHPLPISAPVAGIWVSGAGDVYALASARVWRLPPNPAGPDAGGWSVDYGDVSAPETKLTALIGRNDGDIWVTGERGMFPRCALVAHKTAAGWVTVLDETPADFSCAAADGGVVLGAPVGKGAATAAGELVAISELGLTVPMSFVRVRHLADGSVEIAHAPRSANVKSIWGVAADDLYAASFSVVERGRDIWTDGGSWQVSTVAFEGIPITRPFHVVRGTRSDNVWLAGESYVFHKTSP